MKWKRSLVTLPVVLLLCLGGLLLFFAYENRMTNLEEQVPKPPRVQIILKARANPPDFWRVVEQGAVVAAAEFGLECQVSAPKEERDIEMQIALVREAIEKKPDAIILAAGDYDKLVPVCREVVDKGILLVTVDSDVNFSGRRCFVGTDNYEMGRKLAPLVDAAAGPGGKFGVISHVATTTTAIQREAGLMESLTDAGTRLSAIAYCESSEDLSRQKAIEMIEANPDIKCMVGLNESSALGVAYAVRDLGLSGKIPLIACDSSQKQIEFMEDGTIQAFVVQNPFSMGYLSVQTTAKILKGEAVPEVVYTESVLIQKQDLYKTENQKLLFPFAGDQ